MKNESPIDARWVDITAADGGKFRAWHCAPVNPKTHGPAILLIQEIFGVNAHIRGIAEQYALDGYTVLAPDVFWREHPAIELGYDADGFKKGIELATKASFAQCVKDLTVALKTLRALPTCNGQVAAVGYCMGGRISYLLAAETDIDAAVCYYGGGIHSQLELAPKIHKPIQFHFGAKDAHIPLTAVESIRQAFSDHHDSELYVYDAADHGFNCWARDSYHQPSAALARGRALGFLSTHLKA